MGLKSFRFDAVKQDSEHFLQDSIDDLDKNLGPAAFLVSEFWKTSYQVRWGTWGRWAINPTSSTLRSLRTSTTSAPLMEGT